MTLDVSRPVQGVPPDHVREADFFASLWEAAPFARLPSDAPAELKDLVQDLDNPKRVYAIHRASRRHNFQVLVERYIAQLRYGCDSDLCTTSTCFTCRRRTVGKAPIRRYNPTSARILAVYLASQDNPETGFCPYLKSLKEPPAALNSLVFSPKRPTSPTSPFSDPFSRRRGRSTTTRKNSVAHKLPPPHRATADNEETGEECGSNSSKNRPGRTNSTSGGRLYIDSDTGDMQPSFKVTERPISKDHRSFSANLFSTLAFKMIEWLTPTGLESMSRKVDEALKADADMNESSSVDCTILSTPTASDNPTSLSTSRPHSEQGRDMPPLLDTAQKEPSFDSNAPERPTPTVPTLPHSTNKDRPRRKSSAKVRAACNTTSSRKVSVETIGPGYSDGPPPTVSSPRLNGAVTDKATRPPKTRAIPDVSPSSSLFDELPPRPHETAPSGVPRSKADSTTHSGVENGVGDGQLSRSPAPATTRQGQKARVISPPEKMEPIEETLPDGVLPQSLKLLNMDLVDFVCDVLQDDGTSEKHLFEPPQITGSSLGLVERPRAMRRTKERASPYPKRLKTQWKYFIEQSLFNVLSDPKKLIASFAQNGELLDSHSLWYCMVRLTRVAPTLVFDGLWIAAASLFGPPKSLQSLRSPTTKVFMKLEKSLTNVEAGHLTAICLHALVAAAPLVTDTRSLYEMSTIRSSGLTLAGGSTAARLCLQYHDVFSDDLLLRLARRLFLAISARRCFAEMAVPVEEASDRSGDDLDALRPLLAQLELVGINSVPGLQATQAERELHEVRAPTLLLDWAKTVILDEWDGNPVISFNSPLGGALTLLTAMYEKRQSLLLGDLQFRIDYFADRLDSIDVPVAWLSHNPSRRSKHLLDYPFIFNPSSLVSYFRSINLVRMSQSYEEASSLQTRIKAIVTRDGLIKNAHHRLVLQEMMRTASSKYLILEISRDHVVRDAFDQLWQREERELLRPLKVHLGEEDGEEGFDSGGVQQEFFRLAMEECLDPEYGAFAVDERTRMTWFVPGSLVPTWKFELVGILVSLAVYNGLTLPVTFPKALYRKLLGESVDELHHIADGWPDLASGLTELLEWDETHGSVEDVFVRTYEFSVDMLGQPISREMKAEYTSWPQLATMGDESRTAQNPEDASLVTNENRNAYVSDYIRYLTDVSVRPQFEALARGFRACLHPKSLSLLTPGILQSMVEGVQEIDIGELRKYTRYVGWDASHRAIRDFWSIVKRYDEDMKRKLLEFVTASDRVPVGGMRNLQFVVQKNGEEDEGGHLPTAYTCYGTLLLPEYKDKEVLRERLAMALNNAKGFGFA
ncbi:ubiquitin-protein ligase E3A [Sodiomyces alkalinus F11]|uniref:HECT-type E3 ubiquitin transferase n=1 Tax=Sodiomyces alkalinus (strain CBS 110278 / VKM F-3762 / F11) TaxID=1314773 RepID=A0A3N2PPE6_SODAK|nr:ubiquitin-protein ligase E3A [Sodiomyces alkalinus F11]ROT36226.1 ubiquitin-protein ligase E3A [Sodiomyces alkalinus F11]